MGGAPLWAQAVTFTPGGLAEFMLGADGKAGTQLDDQYLGERHETDDCCFGAHVKAVALLTDGELGDFPRLGRVGTRQRSGGTWRWRRAWWAMLPEELLTKVLRRCRLLSSVRLRTEAGVGARPQDGAAGVSAATTRW
jgi:hypothetical protein